MSPSCKSGSNSPFSIVPLTVSVLSLFVTSTWSSLVFVSCWASSTISGTLSFCDVTESTVSGSLERIISSISSSSLEFKLINSSIFFSSFSACFGSTSSGTLSSSFSGLFTEAVSFCIMSGLISKGLKVLFCFLCDFSSALEIIFFSSTFPSSSKNWISSTVSEVFSGSGFTSSFVWPFSLLTISAIVGSSVILGASTILAFTPSSEISVISIISSALFSTSVLAFFSFFIFAAFGLLIFSFKSEAFFTYFPSENHKLISSHISRHLSFLPAL